MIMKTVSLIIIKKKLRGKEYINQIIDLRVWIIRKCFDKGLILT